MLKSFSGDWKKISLTIALLVVVRGVFVLSVLPPFEGWDEYQHIAYIIHLREHKELPRFGESEIPRSMYELLKRYPHADNDYLQSGPRGWGTKSYATFWTPLPAEPTEIAPLPLYEAQQPPLYYLVALPFWVIFSRISDLAAIYALRLINVLFLAGAVFVFLQTLARCVPNLRHRALIGLLIGTYPLYLITAARVTNCALAILFGSLTLHFTITAIKEKPLRSLLLASCFLGLGILSKGTILTMIPVVLIGAVAAAYRNGLSFRPALKAVGICVAVLLLFLVPLFYRNYKSSGGFYVMAQHRDLRLKGKSTWWVLSQAFNVGWSTHIRQWVFTRDLWSGGWSSISLPDWFDFASKAVMYVFWFLVVGIGLKRGWSRRGPPRAREYLFSDDAHLLIFVSVVAFMVLGLAYFATLSLADYGAPIIIPSYFMIALPAWTALLYQAALSVGAKFAFWFSHVLLAFYVAAELLGTLFIMPPAYTNTTWSWLSWTRLAEIHPAFPSPWFILPSLLALAGLLTYLLRNPLANRLDNLSSCGGQRGLREGQEMFPHHTEIQ